MKFKNQGIMFAQELCKELIRRSVKEREGWVVGKIFMRVENNGTVTFEVRRHHYVVVKPAKEACFSVYVQSEEEEDDEDNPIKRYIDKGSITEAVRMVIKIQDIYNKYRDDLYQAQRDRDEALRGVSVLGIRQNNS